MPKLNLPILASLIFAVPAAAQTTERVSVSDTGAQADSYSSLPVISADGRYVAFHSRASTLVPGDTNGYVDVFLRDRQMGTTTRISVDHLGGQLARGGFDPSISADGRFISFGSHDDFVVPGVGGNARTQVFVYDRITGQVECASVNVQGVEGNQVCTDASISADGRMVAFESLSSNLTPGDTNDLVDVFVRDMHTGEVHRASVNSLGDQTTGGASLDPSISCDGRMIAFQSSANNLASGLNYDGPNIYVHDLVSGQTRLVSVRSNGESGNGPSFTPFISSNGQVIAFRSKASNLVAGDQNNQLDIFVHRLASGQTSRESVDYNGEEIRGDQLVPSLSADGRFLCFASNSKNIVTYDDNNKYDGFIRDLDTGDATITSLSSAQQQGNNTSYAYSISANGRYSTFYSYADNLVPGDTNGELDVFVRDLGVGAIANSIVLTGPITAGVGDSVTLSWFAAPPNSTYWLGYSENLQGSLHSNVWFEIGDPVTILATGTNSADGTGSFTSAPLPASAVGRDLFLELGARAANGRVFDSNAKVVSVR